VGYQLIEAFSWWEPVIVRVDMEPTDRVIELRRQARESSAWHPKQRLDLVPGQLKSELETGANRVSKDISLETDVRQ
jgi:hypothetical protein